MFVTRCCFVGRCLFLLLFDGSCVLLGVVCCVLFVACCVLESVCCVVSESFLCVVCCVI